MTDPVEIALSTAQFNAFLACREAARCTNCDGKNTTWEDYWSQDAEPCNKCENGRVASRVVAAFDAVPTVECPKGDLPADAYDERGHRCPSCENGRVPFVSGDAKFIEQVETVTYSTLDHARAVGWHCTPGRRAGVTIEAIVTRSAVHVWGVATSKGGNQHPHLFDALPSGEWVALCKP